MKQRKIPQRTCVVCRQKFNKRDLTRIVRNKEGKLFVDPTGKANGRGAYLCHDEKCLNKFLSKNFLERAFRTQIPQEDVATIKEELKSIAETTENPN